MKNQYCEGCREASQLFCRKLYYVGEDVRWHKACICSKCLKYVRNFGKIWWNRNESDHLLPEINKLKNDIENHQKLGKVNAR